MKKRTILILLLLISLLPSLSQFIIQYYTNYIFGGFLKLFVHIIVPIIFVMFIAKTSLKKSFLISLKAKDKKRIFKIGVVGSVGTFILILGALALFRDFIDFNLILNELLKINIDKLGYPFVALFIAIINPFIEEYFWRGFVFRNFYKYTNPCIAYSTGILFSLHHMVMIRTWFPLWQFLVITIFLALVGMLFNWLYQKTGSIYASWIIHAFADIIIVIIGFTLMY